MHLLDDPQTFARLDPDGLGGRIRELPEQCHNAWERANAFSFAPQFADVTKLVVLGMGGSAIAGDIVRSLALKHGKKPVFVHRGYDLPGFVDENTLVVASSNSGETEETLSAFAESLPGTEEVVDRPPMKMVITTGGRLLRIAEERAVPAYVFAYEGEPRSSLGHSLMPLLTAARATGVLPDQSHSVQEAIAVMESLRGEIGDDVPFEKNAAKQMATRIQGCLPIVYAAEVLVEAAHRWKTQLNENGKVWAFYEEISELDHNSVEGFGLSKEVARRAHVVFLYHPSLNQRNRLRYEATRDALNAAGVANEQLEVGGESDLAKILWAVYFGDWVSYYLAMLNGVRPSPVNAIEGLKKRLAEAK